MIAVFQDSAGLRRAALELMEEALDAEDRKRLEEIAEMAANREAILDQIPQRRTLSPGYYMWLNYIAEGIVGPMESGIEFREGDLRVEEIVGLRALREARMDFGKAHPPCRGCGKPLENAGIEKCPDCERAALRAAAGRH